MHNESQDAKRRRRIEEEQVRFEDAVCIHLEDITNSKQNCSEIKQFFFWEPHFSLHLMSLYLACPVLQCKTLYLGENWWPHQRMIPTYGDGSDLIRASEHCIIKESNLIEMVNGTDFSEHAIFHISNSSVLCPKNERYVVINMAIITRIIWEETVFLSSESRDNKHSNEDTWYLTRFLKVCRSNLPPYRFMLQVGTNIILLQNMNPKIGLINSMRHIVKKTQKLYDSNIDLYVRKGYMFFCQKSLYAHQMQLTVKIYRKQFPIKVAFAMTINKNQGQTVDRVGI